ADGRFAPQYSYDLCLHGTTGDKDRRNIEAQSGHQHAWRDFVAVGDTDQGVGTVGVDHILDGVGNDLPGRQAVEHAVVAHGNPIVDRNGVELLGNGARGFDFPRHQLAHILQVDVTGHELGKRVGNGNDWLVEVFG